MHRSKFLLVLIVFAILFLTFRSVQANGVTEKFDDNTLNPDIWTAFGDGTHRYAIETSNRLEVRADGTQDDSAGIRFKTFVSINQDFKAKVEFNAQDCGNKAAVVFSVHNVSTDIHHFDEYLGIANGQDSDSGILTRSWIALKAIEDNMTETEIEATSIDSGTLYIEHKGATFYVSYTGFGPENAMASFTIGDWTSPSEIFISLWVWSGNQVLSGNGSFFDNFEFILGSDTSASTPGGGGGGGCFIGL